MPSKLNLNAKSLKWARENVGLDVAELPPTLQDTVLAAERGEKKLTLKQANDLAKRYGVSIYFFYREPKSEQFITEIPDFRSLPKRQQKYSHSLRMLIQKLKQRQNWTKDYFKEEGIKPLSFVNSCATESDSQKVADKIIRTFFQSRKKYSEFRISNKSKYLNKWIERLAEHNVFVIRCRSASKEKKIELQDARGFVLVDKYAPFIFVNSNDHPTAQIFTLIHELAHLFIGKEGVSGEINKNTSNSIEKFCNQAASRVLLTDEELDQSLIQPSKEEIKKVSQKYLISSLSILLRLKEAKKINDEEFQSMWSSAQKEMKEFLISSQKLLKSKKGGGSYYNTEISRSNKKFVKLVYNAYRSEFISGSVASSLLNVKYTNLKKLYKKSVA